MNLTIEPEDWDEPIFYFLEAQDDTVLLGLSILEAELDGLAVGNHNNSPGVGVHRKQTGMSRARPERGRCLPSICL